MLSKKIHFSIRYFICRVPKYEYVNGAFSIHRDSLKNLYHLQNRK